ncbi:NAD(P)/FAD-dependent oxidoreductase [Bacillus mycoides]|uniref:Ferredoxin--NADP reductase n=1 Tax=Bacillus mycoides TaxID=1405 RepID=A0A1E8B652_BACMY|nr:NAD(P)/FAD-dependent oxidoreductase [Bacillus mycoides]OFD77741.1 Ferredoxin--NADP reductase 2 [Bacillus mycoides]OFD77860.1 Ferredoxin--NADP reductase 2 [Bacillus mycoides]OFD79178.1 Ferredoxin--NADP reductase 2 [Bacillus mycoides]
MEKQQVFDITIIGGGPTGLFATFYAGMRNMKVKIIDSLHQLGGQLSELYPDKYIYDVGGFPKVLAKDLVKSLVSQAEYASPEICLEETVLEIKQDDGHFELITNKGVHYSKTILITSGIGAFEPRKLNISNAKEYEGKNLYYQVKDINHFKDSKVLVCGGGDSAVDWSLMLKDIAEEVTLCHRRPDFRAHESSVDALFNSNVKIKTPYAIKELIGDRESIHKVIILDKNGMEEEIEVDHVVVNYGSVSSLGPIKNWNLNMDKNSIIVNTKMETNIKGIYAAGDICTYEGKVKLIAVGFGEAPIAVNNAKSFIDPSSRVQPLHSTSVFK